MLKDPESSLNPPFTSEGHSYFTDKKPEGDHDKSGGKKGSQASLKPNSYRNSPSISFYFGPDTKTKQKQKGNTKVTLPYNNTFFCKYSKVLRILANAMFPLGHCYLAKGWRILGEKH